MVWCWKCCQYHDITTDGVCPSQRSIVIDSNVAVEEGILNNRRLKPMSGGSLDYASSKIACVIDEIENSKQYIPKYELLVKHLFLVKDVLHDIEWAISGDYALEDIPKFMKPLLDIIEK